MVRAVDHRATTNEVVVFVVAIIDARFCVNSLGVRRELRDGIIPRLFTRMMCPFELRLLLNDPAGGQVAPNNSLNTINIVGL